MTEGRPFSSRMAHGASAERDWGLPDEQRAWQSRGSRGSNVARYSRFVTVMKIVLPAAATLLIALLILFSVAGRETEQVAVTMENLGALNDDRQMVNPRLTGMDGRGQPFLVTAKAVSQDGAKVPNVMMFDVSGDVSLQNNSWIKIEASKGLLQSQEKRVTLSGAIHIYTDKGYECHTDGAVYDIDKGLLSGARPIDCQGPLGLIKANGFEGMREAQLMTFRGGVTTAFYPPPRKAAKATAPLTSPPQSSTPQEAAQPVAPLEPVAKP